MPDLTSSVCEILIEGILKGTFLPGSKLLSEREFAEKYSVSRITVRRAFSRLEQAGILIRRRPAGTYIAETFQAHSQEMKSIGLITSLPNEFSGKFVEAVSSCCEKEDLLLALGIPEPDTLESQLKIAVRMASRGVKNLIVWGAEKKGEMAIFERLRILGVNLVFFDQVIPGDFADYVGLNNELAIRSLFRTAAELGKTRFLFLCQNETHIDSASERKQAFQKCLQDSGFDGEIISIPPFADLEERQQFLRKLQAKIKPETAVIAMNAPVLISLFRKPLKHGLLMCVDDTANLRELNAVGYAQPIRKMAEESVALLKNQCLNGKKWIPVHRRFNGTITKIS